jgi:hypothetical protein
MKPRSYLIAFGVIAALLLSPLAASALFLFQAGELSSASSVAKWLVRNDGIYGTALHNNLREISFALYEESKPETLVMSSSRGVDFRREFFRGSFGCACSIMSNIEEGQQFADHISSFPKVVIFGLDYWWFSKTDDHDTVPWKGLGTQPAMNRPAIESVYQWLGERKVSLADFTAVMAGLRQRSPLSSEPKLGIQAIVNANGTRNDGTWSPLGTASAAIRTPDYAPMDALVVTPSLILKEKAGRYSPDQQLDDNRIEQLRKLVRTFESRGSKAVLMLLPIVPTIVDEMKANGRYKFIDELRERLASLGVEYYDAFDPRKFGGSTCEFKDPHHGGNALFAKMLIAAAKADSIIASVINPDVVRDVASRYSGRIVATIGTESKTFHEVDFLRMGCAK